MSLKYNQTIMSLKISKYFFFVIRNIKNILFLLLEISKYYFLSLKIS